MSTSENKKRYFVTLLAEYDKGCQRASDRFRETISEQIHQHGVEEVEGCCEYYCDTADEFVDAMEKVLDGDLTAIAKLTQSTSIYSEFVHAGTAVMIRDFLKALVEHYNSEESSE